MLQAEGDFSVQDLAEASGVNFETTAKSRLRYARVGLLWQAAQKGQALQLEKIVGQGVPVNARDSAGRTALMLAAINGQTTAVQKLLALGADSTLLDRDGLSAARQARRMGHARTAEVIEAGRQDGLRPFK